MRRRSPIASAACALMLTITSSGAVAARADASTASVSQRTLRNGAVIVSLRSADVSVQFIGSKGSRVAMTPAGRSVQASMRTTRPKSGHDAAAYRTAGRSVVDDLVALGMPRSEAQREFGELETLEIGDAAAAGPLAGPRGGSSRVDSVALTPYDTQCARIKVADGKITGYGCSTFFLVHRDGNDWWLTTKMKISAHSSDESWFGPKRLTQLGWRASWAAGNVLYDWDPYQTRAIDRCLTMTVKSSSPWAEVSVQGTVCPDSLGPWSVTTARSGGIWNGMEHGTEYEGALATQAVHSPPGAPVSYQSAWTLSYCDFWCI